MKHAGFVYRRAITVWKIILSVSIMLLLVACADGYTGGGAPATPVFYSPKSDQLVKINEGENTILEVINAHYVILQQEIKLHCYNIRKIQRFRLITVIIHW